MNTEDGGVTDLLWRVTDDGLKNALAAVLAVVYLEAFLWTATRVFFLNFTPPELNPSAFLLFLLVTGWSLAVVGLVGPEARTLYLGASAVLVVGFVVSLSGSPAVEAIGGVAVVTAVTPALVGLLDELAERMVVGLGAGVLLTVGLRAFLGTASPYATLTGTVSVSVLVALAVGLILVLAYRRELPEPDMRGLRVSPAPVGVFLVVSASFLAYPHVVARWGLRSYGASVVGLAAGVAVGLGVVGLSKTPSVPETVVWSGVFIGSVGAFLYSSHPATTAAYGLAWACAVVLLSAGSTKRGSETEGLGRGVLSLSAFQLLAVLVLFGYVSATNWAFMPSPLNGMRGLATEAVFVLHAVFPVSVVFAVARAPSQTVGTDASSVSRRSVLGAAAVSLFPLGGLSARDGGGEEPPEEDGTAPVRVMAYNLHLFLEGGGSGQYSLEEALSVIKEDDPDVIGVLESDGCRVTSGNVDGIEWLGERLGYHTAFGAPTSTRTPGVSILSRWPIEDVEYVELPVSRSPTRVATVATVRTPNGPTRVVATHFMTPKPGDVRDEQAEALVDILEDDGSAVVLGDFNVVPDREEPAYRVLDDAFADAWEVAEETVGGPKTWSASDPVRRIDYVFLKGDWRVREARVSGNPRASDHLAVSAEVEPAGGNGPDTGTETEGG